MDLHVSLDRRGRFSAEVYTQLKQAILDGRLRPGDALPPTRELARRLEVSRNTITNAYERLTAEGFLVGRVGAGTYVATTEIPTRHRRAPATAPLAPRPLWRTLARPTAARLDVRYDFQLGAPDPELFPWDEWRRLVARQLRGRRAVTGYPAPEGDPGLRAAIARHVGVARAVRAGSEDVVVTSGAQQAFDLIARVLIEPGAAVAVEDPGYPRAHDALRAAGARLVPVRVDAEGLDVAALPAKVRLVYVTPSHQFPLGTPMSLARRRALLTWAERTGAAIIEDDYDTELRYSGRPLEPLQSLDRSGRVLYVNTFSKVMLPTLRLGYVIAPPSVVPSLCTAKAVADSHGGLAAQRALAAFIEDGLLARHVRRITRTYQDRRDRLLAAIERWFGDTLVPVPSAAGLHVTALFADRRTDADAIATRARAAGVAVESVREYYASRPRAGLAFGFGLIAAGKIDEAVRRIASCMPRR